MNILDLTALGPVILRRVDEAGTIYAYTLLRPTSHNAPWTLFRKEDVTVNHNVIPGPSLSSPRI